MIVLATAQVCTKDDTIVQRRSGTFFLLIFKLRLLYVVNYFQAATRICKVLLMYCGDLKSL